MIADQNPLETRLFPAVRPYALIERARLTERLSLDDPAKLTLVTAPAGFGKTTLLYQWYERLRGSDAVTAWLSVETSEAKTRNLLKAIGVACGDAMPHLTTEIDNLLHARRSAPVDEAIAAFAKAVVAMRRPLVLFIDDFHFAESAGSRRLISGLIARTPPSCLLVMASRRVPDLDLATARAYGQLREMTAEDLRFETTEAQALLSTLGRSPITASTAHVINDRTEGWAAALQLVALAAKNDLVAADLDLAMTELTAAGNAPWPMPERAAHPVARQAPVDDRNGRITDRLFDSARQDLGRFLTANVFARQTAEIQDFLLRTAVLNRFCAGLCAALTGRGDCQELLEELAAANLFLTPLDSWQRWFRYHHLFRQYLLELAEERFPGQSQALKLSASAWCEEHGVANDAIDYAMDAGAFDRAADLVAYYARQTIYRGSMPQIVQWLERLPKHVWQSRLDLCLYNAWAAFHINRPSVARTAYALASDRFKTFLAEGRLTHRDRRSLEQEMRVIAAGVSISCDDKATVLADVDHEPDETIDNYDWVAGAFGNIAALALIEVSRFADAMERLHRARKCLKRAESPIGVVYSFAFEGLVCELQGHLHRAATLYQKAEGTAWLPSGDSCAAGVAAARVLRAGVLYEWNRIAAAESLLAPNLPLVEECGPPEILVRGHLIMARVLAAQGRLPEALSVADKAEALCRQRPFPERISAVTETRLFILTAYQSDLGDYSAPAEPVPMMPLHWSRPECQPLLGQARRLIALERYSEALRLVLGLGRLAESAGRKSRRIECLLLEARAQQGRGHLDSALDCVDRAVGLAAMDGFTRRFIDEGLTIARLLDVLQSRWQAEPRLITVPILRFIRRLGQEFEAQRSMRHHRSHNDADSQQAVSQAIQPLSAKERAVLRLLAGGARNDAIAEQLSISVNTVKWHLKSVYAKLAVENRTQAANLARKIGIS